MNKILLYIFLLTSLSFYSQVANITHCAGGTTFNLTYQYSLLIGNLNPAETTVSYHLTASDATNGANAISNPTNFIVPQNQGNLLASQTIYARINHLGNITTNYFSLIVNPYFHSLARIEPIDCNNYGTIMLDIFGGQAPFVCFINGSRSTNNFWDYGTVSTLRIPNLVTGTYHIQVIDAIGCITRGSWAIEPSSIIPLSTPTAAVTNIKCQGNKNGVITINATGGKFPLNYSIDNGKTYILDNTFTNLAAGNYTIYIKDASDCIKTIDVSVTEPNLLKMSAATTKPIDCISNAIVTTTATGGTAPYTYSKDGFTFALSNVFENSVAGIYTFYVKDASDCIKTIDVSVTEPNLLKMSATTTKPIDCISNAIVTTTATGGTAPYTYSKDGFTFAKSNVFENSVAGIYTFYVKDANGCIDQNSILISTSTPLSATITKTNVLCYGNNDGSITVNPIGGKAPYFYSLDNGENYITSNFLPNLIAGTHNILLKDALNCTFPITTTINQPTFLLLATISVSNQTVTVNATGGSGTYQYAISPNLNYFYTENKFKNLNFGNYTLLIKDTNGCYTTLEITVNPPAPLVNGNNAITQNFNQGQTLGDIKVEGENIKWYSTLKAPTNKSKKATQTSLPTTTVLTNNTTYYASQTINGIESTERLSVTAKLGSLETTDFVLKDFTYYPNPVKNIFTISNTSLIDEVSLISIKGETVLTKKINNLHYEIDLSNFTKGVYFIKVKAEGAEKTVKLIKE
jgi:guanyl-specific ribonuclease Sa